MVSLLEKKLNSILSSRIKGKIQTKTALIDINEIRKEVKSRKKNFKRDLAILTRYEKIISSLSG